jgi:putative toxin-antitoxin system antitoxin component (TIGR02293 family)
MATRKPGLGPQLRIIEELHERLGLSYADIAAALGADEAALDRWRQGDPAPGVVFARLGELAAFVAEWDRTFVDPSEARAWLDRPIPALANRRPRALISSGEVARITGMLYGLNAGIFI